MVRYLGQLPAAVGNFSCAPLTPESQQMVVAFLRDCLTRHYTGVDLPLVTKEALSSDMSTAITRELVSRAGVASTADISNKKKKPNPYVHPAIPPVFDGGCRDFIRGACYRGDACR